MITYKCSKCGGEMSISPAGDLYCPFCGTKGNFSDAELSHYKEFRTQMLSYLSSVAKNKVDEAATSALWGYSENEYLETKEGEPVTINYLFKSIDDGIDMYMAKESMIYVFGASRVKDAEKMIENTRNIRYPSADVKSLQSYIPSLIARLELKDGRVLLAFSKHENMYPLESFGSLKAAHAEWILSRLENLCCLFEFNDVVHNGINFESVCINPFTHELAIYGGWWKAKAKLPGDVSDLISIRSVSKKVMGTDLSDAPKPFIEFLESKPASNAFDDFKAWDEVIEKKLGGHNFTKFDI